ncbi:amidohydrolase family protein [Oceanobacillus timonensis]|uniref:amidohydrolase family protein n=1 Tax=Oceanobacillus timonensis TaxID=1926285 RepID=UPI001FEB32B8|nr:amidohydrolase [Oceanobacillus timonensis]
MNADLLIKHCSILTPAFEIKHGQNIVIQDQKIIAMEEDNATQIYQAKEILDGKGKLVMPGLIDAHTHTNQQLLRGRISDEYPMIWTRIMVPFESNLREEDVAISAELSCLEMLKSGTTGFIDAGGSYMHKVAEAVASSGLRGVLSCSTMDTGAAIPESMKTTMEDNIQKSKNLFDTYHGKADGRIHVWYSLRSLITCTPELIQKVYELAKADGTGMQTHMNEYPNEISYCLENFQMRPYELLESLGVLDENFLGAHSILLSEHEMELIQQYNSKVVHCPISNAGKGFTKSPGLMQKGVDIGLGTDGAAHSGLSLFDQMKVFKSLMRAFWGVPIFDPVVMPSKNILDMATLGGAKAMLQDDQFGTIEVDKKADMILIDMDQPHIAPTHQLTNTLIESANSKDVADVIVNGKILMKNREVLTLDEERIQYESKKAMDDLIIRAKI